MYISYTHIHIYYIHCMCWCQTWPQRYDKDAKPNCTHKVSHGPWKKIMLKQYKPPFLSERMDKRSRGELLNLFPLQYKPIFLNHHVVFFPPRQRNNPQQFIIRSLGPRVFGPMDLQTWLSRKLQVHVSHIPPWKKGENIFESTEDVGGYDRKHMLVFKKGNRLIS